ncbi:hypothetical protein N825_17665 [Skermanella stibiiresistens SB22]|uniref:Uncharacterized protein n=1 Tax=Skermanella stibiiresistens SB22 TaxID=1385369 RepID=W9H108_9PROT|nr:hypothetical protein [Skermanella stibiiresistens]EWY37438.1 hypothetical protein N825_17665 [Skermanella stibiiresistens SB22]
MLTGTTAEAVVLLALIAVAHILVTALITRKLTATDSTAPLALTVPGSRNQAPANDQMRRAA